MSSLSSLSAAVNPAVPDRNGNGRADPKLDHVPIRQIPIGQVQPSPENSQLYRPINPTDPAILQLADSIRQFGVKEPLVVTEDGYILSGHRRYVAARLANLTELPCRTEPVSRLVKVRMSGYGDVSDEFLRLLREYNRQRVKSLDEHLREEVVSVSPDEAYTSLIDYREKASRVKAHFLKLSGVKRRARITRAKAPLLAAVKEILYGLRKFWPVSDRKIHYDMFNLPTLPLIHASKPGSIYGNNKESYKALVDLLTRARLRGEIPMNAIGDETRPVVTWHVHRNIQDFIHGQIDEFLKGYWRDLMQSQPNQIEIVGEKLTIEGFIRPVAMQYCIPYTLGRGYSSLPPRAAMAKRYAKSGKQQLVVVILSDFDPDGEVIAESFARSMRDDFKIQNIVAIKAGLTLTQAIKHKLPRHLDPKTGSKNYAKFVARYGDAHTYELDGLQPEVMQTILQKTIDSVIDVKAFNHELEQEKKDAAFAVTVRQKVLKVLRELGIAGETEEE